jgi:nucleotidyltransferase/DNA polymerase involved in DNA repair
VIACLSFTPFAIWHARQQAPELQGQVLVTCDKGKVTAVSNEGKAKGITTGLSLDSARARAEDLHIVEANAVTLNHAWDAFLSELYAFSDRIESSEPGRVFIDLNSTELQLLTQAYQVSGGLADTQEAAELLALTATHGSYERDMTRLVALPLTQLTDVGLSARDVMRLQWLGLTTMGELQLWKRGQLEAFLGEGSQRLIRYLKGPYRKDVAPFKPRITLSASYDFDDTVTEPYQLFPVIDWLAGELADQLADRVAYRLQLTAQAAGLAFSGSRLSKLPLKDTHAIVRQAQLALQDSGVLGLNIDSLQITLSGISREAVQLTLWQQRAQLEAAVHAVTARYPGRLFVYRDRNPFMPNSEFRFAITPLGQEAMGESSHGGHRSQRATSAPEWPASHLPR